MFAVMMKASNAITQGKLKNLIPSCNFFCNQAWKGKLSNIKNVSEGLHVFDEMTRQNPIPPISEFNKLLSIFVKLGAYPQSINIFKRMLYGGCDLNSYTFNIAINSYCHMKSVNLGVGLLAVMFKSGIHPNSVSSNCLIKGMISEEMNECKEFFDQIQREGWCDAYTISILLGEFVKAGQLDKGEEFLNLAEDKNHKLDVGVFNTLLDGYCKSGRLKDSMRIIALMDKKHIRPDTLTFNTLINGFCLGGEAEKAQEVFEAMLKQGLKPTLITYSTLLNFYAKNGKLEQAETILKEMKDQTDLQPDNKMLCSLLQGLFSVGRSSVALCVFEMMKKQNIPLNIYSYGIILGGLLKNGDFEKATAFYEEVDRKGLVQEVGFYNIYINGLCNMNKVEDAYYLFKNLAAKGMRPNLITYNSMIKGLCQHGLFHKVKDCLDTMQESGCSPDWITYNTIIRDCLKHPLSQASIEVLESVRPWAFNLTDGTRSILQKLQNLTENELKKRWIMTFIYKGKADKN